MPCPDFLIQKLPHHKLPVSVDQLNLHASTRMPKVFLSKHVAAVARNPQLSGFLRDSQLLLRGCLSWRRSYNRQSTTPVLLRTTKHYSRTTLYLKVLLHYYSVLQSTDTTELQSTTPVLLCTTAVPLQYYCVLQSTTPVTLFYKVLLQHYSVLQSTDTTELQSTTPVLLCTTKYYSVLLQYYSVLQSTTPVTLYYKVLLQYYSVLQSTDTAELQSTTPVLLCTTKYYPSTTLYYKALLPYYSVLQSTTPLLLCTTKYYSTSTLYYKVLILQYYKALLQYCSTIPVTVYYKVLKLLCTTKY